MARRKADKKTERFKVEDEIDRMALDGKKTEWQESTAPAASDPPSREELRGLNLLLPIGEEEDTRVPPGPRRNPPLDDSYEETIL